MVGFCNSAVLVFAQLVGFMSWRLAQIAKIAKTASSVASAEDHAHPDAVRAAAGPAPR